MSLSNKLRAARTSTPALVAALAGSLLAACTVGPDFQRPAAPTASAYTSEALPHLQTHDDQERVAGEKPAADWWTAFHSAALDATVRQAMADSPDLAAATAALAQARESVNASAGGLYPQLALDAGSGREKYGAQFLGAQAVPPFTYYSVGPSVSYLVDYTGGQRRTVEQQRAVADAQAFQLQAAQLSLAGNVTRQALTIASIRAQIDALNILLDQDRRNLALVQTTFDAGTGTRVDLLSAQSQLANDQTLMPPLHQQLSVAQHALAILVGRTPAEWTAPDFDLKQLRLPDALPLTLPSELAHRRPDILAAESRLHAATAAVGVATAKLYPQINLTASIGQQSSGLSNFFDQSNLAWGLAAGLTAPIFEGGTLRAQNRGAKDALAVAAAQYQEIILQSFGQVADVLTALDHDAEQLDAQRNALETSEANLKLTQESFGAGNVGVLQVLDAERLSQQARLGYVRAEAQRYLDSAQLMLALGGNPITGVSQQ